MTKSEQETYVASDANVFSTLSVAFDLQRDVMDLLQRLNAGIEQLHDAAALNRFFPTQSHAQQMTAAWQELGEILESEAQVVEPCDCVIDTEQD
ncbi:hypothetical protein [Schlesneria sp. DSM 10557]|uniref:hypothetical protein n=1 Tax=Schlesneria sp. DSM 10557 TaxID=3044399 RepID=UPI0035A1A711